MHRLTLLFISIVFFITLSANDASFHMSGNHLIPAMETDISVKKEILTIKKIDDEYLTVTVYYEFFNPKEAKKLLVGFEAASPDRGKNGIAPQNDWHPYIKDFTVEMNGLYLPHKITLVADSLYLQNGEIKSLTAKQIREVELEETESDADTKFNYVYYFDANFKKGLNTIKHTYTFKLTGGIHYNYAFFYILTAAMRWGNKQIDDFTLILDLGEYQDFCVNDSPFGKNGDWNLSSVGKILKKEPNPFGFDEHEDDDSYLTRFFIKKGKVVYKALNFKPKNELFLYSPRFFPSNHESFDCIEQSYLPFSTNEIYYEGVADNLSKRILRNLPFARRGYVFSTADIQRYYSKQDWYIPDPSYKSSIESLTKVEQELVKRFSE